MEIEELMKQTFRDDAQTPPPGTWNDIHTRLATNTADSNASSAQPGANTATPTTGIPSHSTWKGFRTAALVAAAAAAATTAILLLHPSPNTPSNTALADTTHLSPAVASSSERPSDSLLTLSQPEQPQNSSHNLQQVPDQRPTHAPQPAQDRRPATDTPTASKAASNHPTPCPSHTDCPYRNTTTAPQQTVAVAQQPTHPSAQKGTPAATPTNPSTPTTPTQQETALVLIPNVITPNGDGINDYWAIPHLDTFGQVQVEIFSSRSHRIYHNDHYDNQFNGADLPAGNYFYVAVFHSKDDNQKPLVRRGVLIIKRP